MSRYTRPRGFALMLVLVLLASLGSAWAVASRQAASSFAIDRARSTRAARDEGAVYALGRGIALLETGSPPGATDIDPYLCSLLVETSAGQRVFVVSFLRLGEETENRWQVIASPMSGNTTPDPMPTSF